MVRTLVEELRRHRSQDLLDGDTPQERYASFRRWTNSEAGHRHLLAAYPQLFHQVDRSLEAAARYVLALLREVGDHFAALPGLIAGRPQGLRAERLALGEGDTHNGGRSVAQIVFGDGSRVLYTLGPVLSCPVEQGAAFGACPRRAGRISS
ncbi:DUF4135 domain-containing protein [Streptomyces sp. NPDC090021]|uniref:DUF4135 domain-containing protein n=1 Tax=Streptomyces sp. NPDC090021 TaxID=3365919 RepID=UPI00381201C9